MALLEVARLVLYFAAVSVRRASFTSKNFWTDFFLFLKKRGVYALPISKAVHVYFLEFPLFVEEI